MRLWLDAHLSPSIAGWIAASLGAECRSFDELGLRTKSDAEAFMAARSAVAVILTKDRDFVDLLDRHGPPPQVIWLTCGNTSNDALKQLLDLRLAKALEMAAAGEPLIEIGTHPTPPG